MNIAVIPARGGSTRIPGKNIRAFHGKPILAYSIEIARSSGLFDKIIVSTDSTHITAVAKAYGAKVHNRAAKLCENEVGTQEVMAAVLRWWRATPNTIQPEFACCIYATAPLMSKYDLLAALEALRRGTMKYVYAVGEGGAHAGQFYFGRPKSFMDGIPLEGNSLEMQVLPGRVCDINTEEDWQRAERMYNDLHPAKSFADQVDEHIMEELKK